MCAAARAQGAGHLEPKFEVADADVRVHESGLGAQRSAIDVGCVRRGSVDCQSVFRSFSRSLEARCTVRGAK